MTLREFEKRYHEMRKKYDILILSELMQLYDERYKNKKEKVSKEFIYNELHDEPIYTKREKKFIISEALKIKNERSL